VEGATVPAADEGVLGAFYITVAKLGADGWEMVGAVPRQLQLGDNREMEIYFKRPVG